MKILYYLIVLLFVSLAQDVFAQKPDSVSVDNETYMFEALGSDTVNVLDIEQLSPAKAALYSAAIPGLGQAYNGKYWKIPIVYGGLFMFGNLIYDNNIQYQYFRRNLIAEIDDNPETINITGREAENLRANRDRFRRFRDLNMILFSVAYFLQIVDAHIDAHLLYFRINPDFTVYVDPAIMPTNRNLTMGLSFKLRF
ncbi:MAG: hypothetical protein IH947_13830 [Bacteroidetes bacterium]|nr:hypothetical protein [Bacteroidota bacterium]